MHIIVEISKLTTKLLDPLQVYKQHKNAIKILWHYTNKQLTRQSRIGSRGLVIVVVAIEQVNSNNYVCASVCICGAH